MLAIKVLVFVLAMVYGALSGHIALEKVEARDIEFNFADATGSKFHVQILYKLGESSTTLSGGSIISPRYVLTAAAPYVAHRNEITSIELYVGSIYKNEGEKFEVTRNEVIAHEDYQSTPLRNDIALIQTPRDIVYSDTVQAVRLPSHRLSISANVHVQTVGFGSRTCGNQAGSSRLLVFDLLVLWNTECREKYENLDLDNIVCVKPITGRCFTFGDAGGALTPYRRREQHNPEIYGILSSGPPRPAGYNVVFVYTRVDSYIRWIHENTNEVFE